ncbi:MAG: hypothetical protein QNJ55_18210 [Xenococcus sp. MO_188.B8]|nr:hypothetical protein [Xenococcus sp. MO_188.B8]
MAASQTKNEALIDFPIHTIDSAPEASKSLLQGKRERESQPHLWVGRGV